MSRNFMAVFLASLILCACPSQKNDKKDPVTADGPKDPPKEVTVEKETASELDELVYEGVGASVLKSESNARSQAELKGRKEIIRVLAEDAGQLIKLFIREQPGFFVSDINADEFGKAIGETMEASSVLKGCKISEYSQSENKDTTFAAMEMDLMNGYETIEAAIITAGTQKKLMESSRVETFKKTFKEFFLKEKKKLLTKPA